VNHATSLNYFHDKVKRYYNANQITRNEMNCVISLFKKGKRIDAQSQLDSYVNKFHLCK